MLECILIEILNTFEPQSESRIFISESIGWTDSSSYVSITIDTEKLLNIQGEILKSQFRNFTIYQSVTSIDSTNKGKYNNHAIRVPNHFKWQKVDIKVNKEDEDNISPPYNPPRFHFEYFPHKNCIQYFKGAENIGREISKSCKTICKHSRQH
jgi:hypothetical protein